MNPQELHTLTSLLSLPTAPFREKFVFEFCVEYLTSNKIPFWIDATKNIVVGVKSKKNYHQALSRRTKEPLRFVIAHMDHPGFHGKKWLKQKGSRHELEIIWHGGSPAKALRGQRVWISSLEDSSATVFKHEAIISEVKLDSRGRFVKTARVFIKKPWWSAPRDRPQAEQLFGAFAFRAPVWQQKKNLYAGGADDIIGVYSILATAKQLWKSKHPARHNFVALLSRAEEVGFIGTIGHFEKELPKKIRRELLVLSLEASRTLPGATIGSGPVVRLGDKSNVFDSHYSQALLLASKKALKTRYQRRIMDGGTCEATAAVAYGFRAVGISVPLGNYHNVSFQGGPDSRASMGPAPEFVNIDDVAGQQSLCFEFIKTRLANKELVFAKHRKDFKSWLRESRKLLSVGI